MDWKLFCIVLATIALSFILILFDKGLEYPLALLAIGSNIITAYVSYKFGKGKVAAKKHPWWPRLVFFLLILATIIATFMTAYYTAHTVLLLLTVVLLIFLLFIYSLYSHQV
jgi:hypothetical protein